MQGDGSEAASEEMIQAQPGNSARHLLERGSELERKKEGKGMEEKAKGEGRRGAVGILYLLQEL